MALRNWGNRIGTLGALTVVLGLAAVVAWSFAISWRPSSDDFMFQGVDVSEANGPVAWETVHAGGADFAYIRATMGADGRDKRFEANWRAVYATGMRRGAIHIFSLCRLAADQADNFNTTVPRTSDALPAAVSIAFDETCQSRPERSLVVSELARFLQLVELHTGKPVLLRVDPSFEAAYRISEAIPRTLWSVRNFFPPDYSARPWRMWQASDMRRIDGVSGPVHWDVVAP